MLRQSKRVILVLDTECEESSSFFFFLHMLHHGSESQTQVRFQEIYVSYS